MRCNHALSDFRTADGFRKGEHGARSEPGSKMLSHFLAVAYPPNNFSGKSFRSRGHGSGFYPKICMSRQNQAGLVSLVYHGFIICESPKIVREGFVLLPDFLKTGGGLHFS